MAQQVIIYPAQSPATGLVVIVPAPGISIEEASAAVPVSVAWREVSDSELPAGGRSDTWVDNGTTITVDAGLLAANDAATLAVQRTATITAFLNDPSVLARVTRAITLVLGEEINLIRAAFVLGTAGGVWNPASMANGAGVTSPALTVAGAAFGDVVDVGPPYSLAGITATGYVSAASTVVIRLHNGTGAVVDLASGTWGVAVRRPQFAAPRTTQQLLDAVTAKIQAG